MRVILSLYTGHAFGGASAGDAGYGEPPQSAAPARRRLSPRRDGARSGTTGRRAHSVLSAAAQDAAGSPAAGTAAAPTRATRKKKRAHV
mmetsp:Transcript_36794/g.90066  ORF Transcript_36794/g.90066 Transcript_36794/m.90066 type:complete len:89 (-) Transcript_36794:37-303(-)